MQYLAGLRSWRATVRSGLVTLAAVALVLPVALVSGAAPVLVVPPSRSTLHVAVDLPKGTGIESQGLARLVELGNPGSRIEAQVIPAVAADGTAETKSGRIVADIPPREGATGPRRLRLEAVEPGPAAAPGVLVHRYGPEDAETGRGRQARAGL